MRVGVEQLKPGHLIVHDVNPGGEGSGEVHDEIRTMKRSMTRALTDNWTLGGVPVANRVVLAPLAGIGNWFVRLQARRYGAGLAVSEMVSSFAVHHQNERTCRELLRIHPDEHPVSVQLFGHDPDVMASAAEAVAAGGRGPDRHQHGLPGPEGLQDRRRRSAAR